MSFAIWRKHRSIRLRVTTPEGRTITVDNLKDDGFHIEFSCVRGMSHEPGTATVSVLNLPPEILGELEAAQEAQVDNEDSVLVGQVLQSSVVEAEGSDALAAGFLVVEVEAGYENNLSRVFRVVGAKATTADDQGVRGRVERDRSGRFARLGAGRGGGVTIRTTFAGDENLDGALLGLPLATFPAGSSLFELVDYLRRIAGLGPGNLSYASFMQIAGDARLDAPYHVSGGRALAVLTEVLKYYAPLRWFIDDREFWICGRDGVPNPNGAVAWIADGEPEEPEPIIGRPAREDGGLVSVSCFLCPRIRPGRLVRLTPGGLGLLGQGTTATPVQVERAQVPPGVYRCERIEHTGTSVFRSTMLLRPLSGGG